MLILVPIQVNEITSPQGVIIKTPKRLVGNIPTNSELKRLISTGYIAHYLYLVDDYNPPAIGDYYVVELYDVTGKSRGLFVEQVHTIDGIDWVNDTDIAKCRHILNCKKIIESTDPGLQVPDIPKSIVNDFIVNNSYVDLKFTKEEVEYLLKSCWDAALYFKIDPINAMSKELWINKNISKNKILR